MPELVEFINEKAGTHRTESGTLKPTAGRVSELDAIIEGVTAVDAAVIAKLKDVASTLAPEVQNYAKIYVSIAEKIVSKGVEYVDKEGARLSGIINSASVTAEKKTAMMLKYNVLMAFIPKVDEKN